MNQYNSPMSNEERNALDASMQEYGNRGIAAQAKAAQSYSRPASQVLRDLMREFVQRQRQTREYDEFLLRKVQAAHLSMHAGSGTSNDEVEVQFAAHRAKIADMA